jgi:Flp pilus assembly protein TadD
MPKPLGKKHRKPDLLPYVRQGLEFEMQGRTADAQQVYEGILAVDDTNSHALNRLAVIAHERGDDATALDLITRSLKSNPVSPEAVVDYAQILGGLGRYDDMLAAANRALILKPNTFNALFLRGDALNRLGRHQEALTGFDRALALKPDDPGTHNARGVALVRLGRVEDALVEFERTMALDPGYAEAHFHAGLARLLSGDFATGWKEYEWRLRLRDKPVAPSPYPQPYWDGATSLDGRSLYVAAEQGLGDAIMFARYLPLLAGQGARVVFGVDKSLKALLASLDKVEVVSPGDEVATFDLQCALLSLPHLLGTRLETIPARIPYLAAPPERVEKWRPRLPEGRKIGLVWAGGQKYAADKQRSLGAAGLAPILAQPGFGFISLQRELGQTDAAFLRSRPDIVHFGEELGDFADTAAIVSELDLVISVDTSVAHLAGALGKPLWVLLPFSPDFRWLLGRTDSPWYPTATLFRQPAAGDWPSVVAAVAAKLAAM